MKLHQGVALALCLILQNICQVSTQESFEFGGGYENFLEEDPTVVPTVNDNDLQESEFSQPGDGDDGGQAFGAMFSGVDDSHLSPVTPDPVESGSEELSGSVEVNGTVTLPPLVSPEDDLSVNDITEEDGAVNTPEPLQPTMSPQNETLSADNDTALLATSPEPVSTSPEQINSTVKAGDTDPDSSVSNGLEVNSTESINPTPGSSISSSPSPADKDGLSNATEVNNTMGDPYPHTDKPTLEEDTTTTGPTTPSSTETSEDSEDGSGSVPMTTGPNTNATAIGKAVAGDNSERGLDSNSGGTKGGKAWGVIFGIALAVGFVGFTAYVLLKRRRREFAHSKLVEETNSDPVLRLDNSEPLDLKYDGFGYQNPALQGDNIQMANFPSGQLH